MSCCKTIDELQTCLQSGDFSAIPTAQTNLRNFELPLCKSDAEFLSGEDAYGDNDGVDLYDNPTDVPPAKDSNGNMVMSVAQSLVRSGLRFRTDFVLDAICLIVHAEPYSWMLNGNRWLGQDEFEEYPYAPSSPKYVLHPCIDPSRPMYGMTYGGAAQLEWGGPTWRAAHFFLHSFRLAMMCPEASNSYELLNERLVDLGNCNMGTGYNGFGDCGASGIYGVRRVNRRLHWLTHNNQVPNIPFTKNLASFAPNEDLGYFLPFNNNTYVQYIVEQCGCVETSERMFQVTSAYGAGKVSPFMCRWYRLPVPRVISSEDNLEILLKRDVSDNAFYDRMLQEMAYHDAMSPIPDVSGQTTLVQIIPTEGHDCPATINTIMCRIPGGQMRVGIALKGHMIDRSLCCQIKKDFNAMTIERAMETGVYRAKQMVLAEANPALDTLPVIR